MTTDGLVVYTDWPMKHPAAALAEMGNLRSLFSDEAYRRKVLAHIFETSPVREELDAESYAELLRIIPDVIDSCAPYFWSSETYAVVQDAAANFPAEGRTWDAAMFPQPAVYWAQERDHEPNESEQALLPDATGALSTMLGLAGNGDIVYFRFMLSTGGLILPLVVNPLGRIGQPISVNAAPLAGILEFLNSPYVGVSEEHPPRPERRRAKKEGRELPSVRIVVLRKREKAGPEQTERAVEWSCRWLVRGHWRNQWYPAAKVHRPVWIAGYLKGPSSKPFRRPTEVIFAVKR